MAIDSVVEFICPLKWSCFSSTWMYSSPSTSISILLTDGVDGLVADNPTMSQVVLTYMLSVAGAIET